MPYTRRRRARVTTRRRRAGASSIQKAWRRRKRRKIGLVQRTLMANRNNLRRLKKKITTQVQEDEQALVANNWDGQYNDNLILDNEGQYNNLPYSPSLLRLPFGGPSGRKDAWIQMKSLTMKYCVTAGDRFINQRVTLMLVLDTDLAYPSDIGEVLKFTGATVAPPANKYDLAYQNLNNTGGPQGRFKILWKKTHLLSTNAVIDTVTVPAITQENVGQVMRPAYENQSWTARTYPGRVYGSITIKRPYKLNYGENTDTRNPLNQSIRLYGFSTAEGSAGGSGAVIQYYCRFRFKDL